MTSSQGESARSVKESSAVDIDYRVEWGAPADERQWQEVVTDTQAPLFYRPDVLTAYQRFPLRRTLAVFRAQVFAGDDPAPVAVLPMFLVPDEDPLGVVPHLMPGFRRGAGPLLLSHVWHWYDTHLPTRRTDLGLLEAVCRALSGMAAKLAAQGFGFMNLAEGGTLARLLTATGRRPLPIDARYVQDLRRIRDGEEYLRQLPPKGRQDLRRHLRLAARAGAEVAVRSAKDADLPVIAQLCVRTSAKHGNATWYDPEQLVRFVWALREHVRVVDIRIGGVTVAASISFVDGLRFHNWAAGTVSLTSLPFSPYLVLLHATVAQAVQEGCLVLEGGRRNDAWKQRLGMTRVPLFGWLASVP